MCLTLFTIALNLCDIYNCCNNEFIAKKIVIENFTKMTPHIGEEKNGIKVI